MEVAAVVALAGLVGTVGSLRYLHLTPTGLSPMRAPVRQYGTRRIAAGTVSRRWRLPWRARRCVGGGAGGGGWAR